MTPDLFIFGAAIGAIVGCSYFFFGLLTLIVSTATAMPAVDRLVGESTLRGVIALLFWPLALLAILIIARRQRLRRRADLILG